MKRPSVFVIGLALLASGCGGESAAPATTAAATTTVAAATTTVTPSTTTTTAPATTTTEAANPYPPGSITPAVLMVDEIPRQYLVAVPPDHSPDVPAPLVFDLHGRGGNAPGQALTSHLTDVAWAAGFVVVHPQAIGEVPTWSVYPDLNTLRPDVDFFTRMIDHFAAVLGIDEERVFITGFSNGGGMAGRLACELGDRIAGIAPVGASNEGWTICEPGTPIPVLAIHGVSDEVVPYDGGRALLPNLPDWAAWWAENNECVGDPDELRTAAGTALHWRDCPGGATVSLLAIDGIGHMWPPRVELATVDGVARYRGATEVIVDFFAGL